MSDTFISLQQVNSAARDQLRIEALSDEAIKNSANEGQVLDRRGVQPRLCQHLGLFLVVLIAGSFNLRPHYLHRCLRRWNFMSIGAIEQRQKMKHRCQHRCARACVISTSKAPTRSTAGMLALAGLWPKKHWLRT